MEFVANKFRDGHPLPTESDVLIRCPASSEEIMQSAGPRPVTVLIVEDEPIIRMEAADFLSSSELSTFEASNADDALKILSELDGIDVVFTDVNMPGSMDGLQLAFRLREASPHVGIIICSGMVRVAKSGLPDGAIFVEKPYDLAHIERCVRKLSALVREPSQ